VVPTVYLVGIDELERIPELLDRGLIVVVSPDLTTLRRWQDEQGLAEPSTDRSTQEPTAVVIEMNGGGHVPKHATLSLSERAFPGCSPDPLTESGTLSAPKDSAAEWSQETHVAIDIWFDQVGDRTTPNQAGLEHGSDAKETADDQRSRNLVSPDDSGARCEPLEPQYRGLHLVGTLEIVGRQHHGLALDLEHDTVGLRANPADDEGRLVVDVWIP
jgi:hypothetical protein